MNRRIVFFALVLLTAGTVAAGTLFAQEYVDFDVQRGESELYVRTLYIEEVYVTRHGYRLLYRRSNGRLAYTHLPIEWFGMAAARGSVIYSNSDAVPYMNVVFIDGEESHVNLCIPPNRQHIVYRPVDMTTDWEAYFENIEELNLEY